MKLSKKQREEVVELLRCAWDMRFRLVGMPFSSAAINLGTSERTMDIAAHAVDDIACHEWRDGFLEAAQRVEERSWP